MVHGIGTCSCEFLNGGKTAGTFDDTCNEYYRMSWPSGGKLFLMKIEVLLPMSLASKNFLFDHHSHPGQIHCTLSCSVKSGTRTENTYP